MRSTVVLSLALLAGCAVGRQLVTPRDEYRLYRQTRLAPTVEERLAAANRYLHRAPNGAYAPELKAWFGSAEPAYVAHAHDELPMLLAYAKALPDGPSIVKVRERIEELESAERFARSRENAHRERVESLEASLERAAEQRKAFVGELTNWIAALASVRSYGRPLAALPSDVLERFAISDPAAGCPLDVCARSVAPRFAIPQASTQLVPREAAYTAELSVASAAVAGLRLHGRELFSRVGEALDLRPVSFADPQSRAEAIGRTLLLVQNALGPALAADGCERPAVSPVVLERACDGVHVTVTAAIDSGADDVIAFEALPRTPPASSATPAAPAPKRPKH
jgi:hypothetical protein